MRLWAVVLGVAALCSAPDAMAHAASTSYVSLEAAAADETIVTWDLPAMELHRLLGLDVDHDSRVTWGEVVSQRDRLSALVQQQFQLLRGGRSCRLTLRDISLARHAGEIYVSLPLEGICAAQGRHQLTVTAFFAENTLHRTLLDARTSDGKFTAVLSPSAMTWRQPDAPGFAAVFGQFVWQGMLHVWAGYDHVAFIVLLLLPSARRSRDTSGRSAGSLAAMLKPLVLIVTMFTVAHSVTLALAATGMVSPPTAPVEAAIALSIIVAALINLAPRAERLRLPIAFGFGLVHGFGFANVFADLVPSGARLLPVLGGFNVGVELAQLTIVAAALPVLLIARHSSFYSARLMPATSLAIASLGAFWLAERLS